MGIRSTSTRDRTNLKSGCSAAVLLLAGAATLWGQLPPDPIQPPTTPNTVTGGFNTLKGTLRAKATSDEYWCALGQNVKYAWIAPTEPCPNGQVAIPKVDQGYIWGAVLVNGVAYFGTQSNAECIGEGALSNQPNGPASYQTDSWACEFGVSPYSPSPPAPPPGGLLPGQIGDQRPPRMYSYNLSTHVITDITPKLGGSPGSFCDPHTGANPLCIDQLWYSLRGVRTATSYTEPLTGRTYLIISGPALVQASNALDFYAMDISGPSSPNNGKWVAKYQYVGYNDMRHWITVNGVLYAPVGKPGSTQGCTPTTTTCGGALVRYTGNFATLPPLPIPGPSNNFNQIPSCGTTSQTIPPGPAGSLACFAFQDEGDFDGVGTDVVAHTEINPTTNQPDTRLVVATWPPPSAGSLWLSPPIPSDGFGSPSPAPPVWKQFWNYGSNYDPDPLLAVTVGTGALADFCLNQTPVGSIACPQGGTLYWGTMVYGNAGTLKWLGFYYPNGLPPGTTQQQVNQIETNTFRTGIILNTNTLLQPTPTLNLLYGQSTYNVWTNPMTGTPCAQTDVGCVWTATPNNMGGATPVFGASGFGNPYNNYIWTMAVFNKKLYVGTMDWGYPSADRRQTVNISLIPNYQYGADLWTFATPISATNPTGGAATAESLAGQGNYLNYGIRAMLVNGTTSILFGTANPMNLATTSTVTPHGGWELIEAVPGAVTTGR
jgi:hypothetical protein